MDPQAKKQAQLLVSLENNDGYKLLIDIVNTQKNLAENKAKNEKTAMEETLRSVGELRGLQKVLNLVPIAKRQLDDIEQQRKDA